MPLWNYAFNQGGPDPDYVYSTVEIDPDGRVPDLGIPRHLAVRRDHPAGLRMFLSPSLIGRAAPCPDTNDLDDLKLGDDGSFSVILSAERPDGLRR